MPILTSGPNLQAATAPSTWGLGLNFVHNGTTWLGGLPPPHNAQWFAKASGKWVRIWPCPLQPVTIITQPQGLFAAELNTATFVSIGEQTVVAARGFGALTYNWVKQGGGQNPNDIQGLGLTSAQPGFDSRGTDQTNITTWQVTVTDANGDTVLSNIVTIECVHGPIQ